MDQLFRWLRKGRQAPPVVLFVMGVVTNSMINGTEKVTRQDEEVQQKNR